MLFLRANRASGCATWWAAVAAMPARTPPPIVTELLRDNSVVCERPEADEAIAWAEKVPGWNGDTPAIWLQDSIAERLARGVEDVSPGIAPES